MLHSQGHTAPRRDQDSVLAREGLLPEQLEPRVLLASGITGSADHDSRLTLSYELAAGTIAVIEEFDSGIVETPDFAGVHSSPALSEPLVSWQSSQSQLVHGAAPSSSGLLLFTRAHDLSWSWRNLTQELGGAPITNITRFEGQDGSVHVAGLAPGGDVALYSASRAGTWAYKNLSDLLRANGQATPQFTGGLISFVTGWDARNIIGLDSRGDIRAVWWAPGLGVDGWREGNLSATTGAPALTGALTAYTTSWNGINLIGTDAHGQVQGTWWVPGHPWRTSDLTSLFNGPRMSSEGISSFVTPWGALNIVGRSLSGDLTAYWWAPSLDGWRISTDFVPGGSESRGVIAGIPARDGTINLVAQSNGGEALRYYWRPNDQWRVANMSDQAAPPTEPLGFGSVDFLDITGLGRIGHAEWDYRLTATGLGESVEVDATGRVSSVGNGSFTWALDVDLGGYGDVVAVLPETTFERRWDGVYLTRATGAASIGGAAAWEFSGLKLTPPELSGTHTGGGLFEINLPSSIDGELGGTATSTTSIVDARRPVTIEGVGSFTATIISVDLDFVATGWLDVPDDGQGQVSGTIREFIHLEFWSVPGVGSIRLVENITLSTSGFGQEDFTLDFSASGDITHLDNSLRGAIQRGSSFWRKEPYIEVSMTQAAGNRVRTDTPTWVVIHGRESSGASFDRIADLIDRHDGALGDDQVFVLDWAQGAADNDRWELSGAAWISLVGEWAAASLQSLNISYNELVLVGHSWGALVAREIAAQHSGAGRVRAIVALDPATEGWGYNDWSVNFGEVSQYSWAFDGDGRYGSSRKAATAAESFILEYGGGLPNRGDLRGTDPEAAHAAPVLLFEQLVEQNLQRPVPDRAALFRLDYLYFPPTNRPWRADQYDGDHEGQFSIRDSDRDGRWGDHWSEITLFQYVGKDGREDDI